MKRKLTVLSLLLLLFTLAFSLVACGGGGNSGVSGDGCEHEWKESIDFEATCTEKGGKTLYCMKCDETRQDVIEPLGHDIVVTQGKAPTCTEGGLTDGEFCNRCNNTIKEQTYISPKNHTEVKVPGVAATCEEDGLTDGYYCSVCQTVLVEQTVIPSDGHNIETIWGYAATCTEAGLTNGERCTRCDYKLEQTVISANGHSEEIDEGYAATCTEAGLSDRKYCTTCWTTLVEEEVIPALGHSIKNYTSVNATCKDNGVVGGKYCERCQFVFEESTVNGKGNHKFVNGVCEYCEIKTSSGLAFEAVDGGLYQVSGIGSCTDTVVVIPDEHEGKAVVGIKAGAFAGSSITEVIVTDNVTYVGDGAFEGCSSLKSVTLSKSVVSVGENAFDACTALEEIKCADFYQTAGWHHNYFGSTRAKIVADTVNGMKPHEIYEMAMSSINANLNNYAFDDVRRLSVDKDKIPGYDSLDPTTKLFLDLIEMEFRTYAEFSGNDFYIYQYEKSKDVDYSNGMNYTAIDVSSFSKLWYYDGYYYQQQGANGVVTPNSSVKKSMGTLYVKDKLATTLLYVYTEDFFKDANFVINSDGSVSLTINVSGDAMTEFLYIMAEMNEALEDTFKQLDFAYTDVTYIYNFDKNGNISEILCDAGFRFAGTGDGYLTGTIAIEQSFSEVGTLEEIVTKPTGEFKDASYPYTCSHTSKKTVEGYAATCEKEGLTDGAYCLSCLADITLPSTIAAKKHNVVNYTCTKCGEKMGFSAGLKYDYNADGKTATLVGLGACRDENIIIPTEINGIVVTKIAKGAFTGSNVLSIEIPSSVAEIEEGAFDGADSLTKISLSAVLVKYLPKTIAEVAIIDGDTITSGSFENFKNLTTITIGQSVETIEDGAFVGCDRLVIVYNFSDIYIEAGSDANGGVAKNALDVTSWSESNYKVVGDFVFKTESNYGQNDKHYLVKYLGDAETLTLPEDFNGNVYSIASGAFAGVSSIKTLIAPKGIKANLAWFEDCTSEIVSISADASLIEYMNYEKLEYADIVSGSASGNFLSEAPELIEVRIDSEIIGDYGFSYCPKLTTVIIGSNVKTYYCYGLLSYCESLTELKIENGAQFTLYSPLQELDGVSLVVEDAGALCGLSGDGSIWSAIGAVVVGGVETRDIVIPDGITEIADGAFYKCTQLDSVTLADSVEVIGAYAFEDSTVKTVITGTGLTTIEGSAFENSQIKTIALPDGFLEIGNSAFKNSKIETIAFPEGMLIIDSNAFHGASSLREIVIPASVKTLGGSAFYDANALRSVVIGSEKIGQSAFEGCGSLISVTLLDTVKEISNRAFYACGSLTTLDLGSVEKIGDSVFYYNSSLTELNLPETLKKIGNSAFYGIGISTVTLPASLEEMGSEAFGYCESLKEVINKSALTLSTSDINDSVWFVTSGEEEPKIKYDENGFGFVYLEVTTKGHAAGRYYLVNYTGSDRYLVLPDGYNGEKYDIAKYAFAKRDFISVVISDGVEKILERAFYQCPEIISVTIGNSVKSIANNAFGSSMRLVEVIYPEGYAFTSTPFQYMDVHHSGATKIDYVGDFAFYTNSQGKVYLIAYVGNSKEVILPETYKGEAYHIFNYAFENLVADKFVVPETLLSLGYSFVTHKNVNYTEYEGIKYIGSANNPYFIALGPCGDSIGENVVLHPDTVMIAPYAFDYKTEIKTVYFGESLKYIGDGAFYNCQNLEAVILPDTVEYIGISAFIECYKVKELYLGTSIKVISDNAFYYTGIEELTIPESVIAIGSRAFGNTYQLKTLYFNAVALENENYAGYDVFYVGSYITERENEVSVIIGDGVTIIPDDLTDFVGVTSLTVVDIQDLVYIGAYAFYGVEWLTEIDLPNVEFVGTGAFKNAINLKSVKFSDKLLSVGASAFEGCTSLESVELGKDTQILGGVSWNDYAFYECSNLKYMKLSLASKKLFTMFEGFIGSVPVTKIELIGDKVCDEALYDCSGITEIIIADSVTEIGDHALYNTGITEIVLPEGLKSIGEKALAECDLIEVVIPRGTEYIGAYVLAGNNNLQKLEMPYLTKNPENAGQLAGYVAYRGYVAPKSLTYLKLTNVSTLGADLGQTDRLSPYLETLIIEGDVTEIPEYFTSGATALTTVVLPESITKIGENAFKDSTALASVSFGNATGWYSNGELVSVSESDLALNAQLLKTNLSEWTREED